MANPIVVIDPGHGGRTKLGGSSPNNAHGYNGLLERDLTLDLARRVVTAMSKRVTADVRLTRATDVNLSLADRAAVARNANADIFLSIHFNGSNDAAVDGTETWTANNPNSRSQRLAQRLCTGVATAARVRNRGVKQRDLGVLLTSRHARNTAACLLEVAFLSNRAQADKLKESKYLDDIALIVAQGIGDSLAGTDAAGAQAVIFGKPANQRLVSPPFLGDHLLKPDKSRLPASTPTLAIRWNFNAAAAPTTIDLAIHFHGFVSHGTEINVASKADASGIDLDQRKRPTIGFIPRGWKTGETTYAARKDKAGKLVLDAAGKKILDPQMDKVHFPALVDGGGKGLVDLIGYARTWIDGDLARRAAGTTRLDRLILTAHSGGGARLLKALGNGQDPHEIHGFDCFYEPPATAVSWVARHIKADSALMTKTSNDQWAAVLRARGGACRIVAGRGTLADSRTLQKAIDDAIAAVPADQRTALRRCYRVEQTSVSHGDIPNTFGTQLFANAAADLTPAVTAVAAVAPVKAKDWAPAEALGDPLDGYYACLSAHLGIEICPAIPPMCIPPRKADAPGGHTVMALPGIKGEREPAGKAWKAREDALFAQIAAGNVPSFLRALRKVSLRLEDRNGTGHDVEYFVMPDYLAVGSDSDFVTVPLDGITAQRIAIQFGCVLPTAKMVWDIHGKADLTTKVVPKPYAALANPKTRDRVSKEARAKFEGKDQASTWAHVEYSDAMRDVIGTGLSGKGMTRQALVSGYRKDVIVSNVLIQDPSKLCFFGGWLDWTNAKGEKRSILQGREGGYGQQGPHHARYADYSHGVRLVSYKVVIDGKPHNIASVIKDKDLGPMLAKEAPFDFTAARYR